MRSPSVVIAAASALALVPTTSAGSGVHTYATAASQSSTLVAYKEEQGGIVFRSSSLKVSTHSNATVRFEGCVKAFHLDATSWKKLKAALKQTSVHALAGNHGPATPQADETTWVIVVGHDTVRTRAFSIPPELRVKLEPLLKVLGEVLSVYERRLPRSCGSKRTVTGTG
jgi:hypothetical protein